MPGLDYRHGQGWPTRVPAHVPAGRRRPAGDLPHPRLDAGLVVGGRHGLGDRLQPAASGVTFAEAFTDWQQSRTLSERTIRDEKAVARRYLANLQTRRIQDISITDVAAVLHTNRHLADWTRVHIYRVLAGVFAHALRRGLVSRNPMDGNSKAERPRQRNQRNVARLVSTDINRLIAAASTDRDRAAIGLAAYAGLRIGEVRALHWAEVDFDAATITVLRSCMEDGSFKEPKSEAGVRTVPMLPALRALLVPLARFDGLVIATQHGRENSNSEGENYYSPSSCAGAELAPLPRRRQTAGRHGRHRREAVMAQPPPLLRLLPRDGTGATGDDGGADHGARRRRLHLAGLREGRPHRRQPHRRRARPG